MKRELGYSTRDNSFILMSLIQKYLSKKKGRFYCIFIHLEKAFDNVIHEKLWDALSSKGIVGKFLSTLQSLYSQIKSCVKVGDTLTEYFSSTVGTRKACAGSPQLFTIFINQLVDFFNGSIKKGVSVSPDMRELNLILFADDVSSFGGIVSLKRLKSPNKILQKNLPSSREQLRCNGTR